MEVEGDERERYEEPTGSVAVKPVPGGSRTGAEQQKLICCES